ncbi:MAG: S8 family serine peptidase, partial [Armatimonadetes bacterium]|nr:S8 family serine peptidase [Armatimonadota bacterium]
MGTGIVELGYARPPAKPRLYNTTISQGINNDTVTNIKNWQDNGLTGNGVKVAIIDAGFIGLAALKAADELPASAIEVDYSGTGMEATTEHGCGVAETVYDVAPEAQLYLIKISDETDLREAEIYCKTNGVKVINHSIGWDGFNFFDGVPYVSMVPSPVSQVDDANGNGILWVNSAGNDRQAHALIQWRDANGDGLLDWNPAFANINQIGDLSAGTPVVVSLTWNKWPTTNQDFDLFLVRWTGSTWETVAVSAGWQRGTEPPTELLGYVVPSSKT